MHLVLFDCDGTLADSFVAICAVMDRTFEASGRPVPGEATREVIGLSLDIAISRLLRDAEPAEIARMTEAYRAEFHRMRTSGGLSEALFPQIEALVRDLWARDDVLLGIVTGKSRRGVRALLGTHALEDLFTVVRTADDCPSKPHPAMVLECCAEAGVEPGETLVIGDSIYDMQMARAAGATGFGVAWGGSRPAALREAGAAAVATDVLELRRLILEHVGPPSAADRGAIR